MVQSATINSTNEGPTLEEEAAALDEAAKAAEANDPKLAGEEEEETPGRPEWLPEKFNSPEDLAKAYAELEKAQGGKSPEGEATTEEAEEAAKEAVENAGLDMEALSNEYSENGELSEASLEALAKVGISKEVVDAYIEGQEARSNAVREALLEPVGGEEAYNEMVTWAADNLSESEIDTFNEALESGNMASIKLAVENLNSKYTAANGAEPSRQLSGKTGAASLSTYESTADLMKDMQNPEYANNPAFRAKVEQKLARSSIL